MKLKNAPLAALCCCAASVAAGKDLYVSSYKVYDFEDGKVPVEFSCDADSKLTVVDDLFHSGKRALRWDWNSENSRLVYRSEEAFKGMTGIDPDRIVYQWVTVCNQSTFQCQIFCMEPLRGRLRCDYSGSGFMVNANFSQWRKISLIYGRDLSINPDPNGTTITIRPPEGMQKGTIWLDNFAPRLELDVRASISTPQTPYVGSPKTRTGYRYSYNYPYIDENEFEVPEAEIDLSEIPALPEDLRKRFDDEVLERFRKAAPLSKTMKNSLKTMRTKYNLVRNGAIVSGNLGHPMKFYGDLALVGRELRTAALTDAERKELETLAFDMVDLILQRGHQAWYYLRESFVSPLLHLEKELRATNRWKPLLAKLRTILEVDSFYHRNQRGDCDFWNTQLMACLALIAMGEPEERAKDLAALQYSLNHCARQGEIQPDGSLFHHNFSYHGYSLPTIPPLCKALYLLRGTPFFPETMYQVERDALLKLSFYSAPYSPNMFGGRHRDNPLFNLPMIEGLLNLACATETPDRELAGRGLYLLELNKFKENNIAKQLRAAGYKAIRPEGTLALNYSVLLTQRHEDAVLTIRGRRAGIRANEGYCLQGQNTMGRYTVYGQYQIISKNPAVSGYTLNQGWDFNHWPGTTVRVLPHDALRSQFEIFEETTLESFCGAVTMEGKSGAWGMKLQEELPVLFDQMRLGPPIYWLGKDEYIKRCNDARFDTSFRARKSLFTFGNVAIALGSGIHSDDKSTEVVTTLAQNALIPDVTRTPVDAKRYLIDAAGNGYYFGDVRPEIRRGEVEKPYYTHYHPANPALHSKIEPNKGNMELIYLSHGKAPENASYRYMILIQPDEKEMADFAAAMDGKTPPFRVLRQDTGAHVVQSASDNTIGAVFFDAGDHSNTGVILSVDAPCVTMQKQTGNTLKLSLLNPRFDDPCSEPERQRDMRTVIRLSGKWKLAKPNDLVKISPDGSTLEFINRDLIATEAELQAL